MVRFLFRIRHEVGACKAGTQSVFVELIWKELDRPFIR